MELFKLRRNLVESTKTFQKFTSKYYSYKADIKTIRTNIKIQKVNLGAEVDARKKVVVGPGLECFVVGAVAFVALFVGQKVPSVHCCSSSCVDILSLEIY